MEKSEKRRKKKLTPEEARAEAKAEAKVAFANAVMAIKTTTGKIQRAVDTARQKKELAEKDFHKYYNRDESRAILATRRYAIFEKTEKENSKLVLGLETILAKLEGEGLMMDINDALSGIPGLIDSINTVNTAMDFNKLTSAITKISASIENQSSSLDGIADTLVETNEQQNAFDQLVTKHTALEQIESVGMLSAEDLKGNIDNKYKYQ